MALSIDFALEGLRIIKRRPTVLPIWGLVLMLGIAIGLGTMIAAVWPMAESMRANGGELNPAQVPAMILAIIGPFLLYIVVTVLSFSVVQCAIFRAALEEPRTTVAYLKLGGDEFRNILLNFVFVFVVLALEFVCLGGGAVVGAVVDMGLNLISRKLTGVGVTVGMIAGVIAMVWCLLRLSLFSIMSFHRKNFDLLGSWALTKGHAGTLLVGYFVAAVLSIAFYIGCLLVLAIVTALLAGIGLGLSGAFASGGVSPDPLRMVFGLVPAGLVYFFGLTLVLVPLLFTITGAPPAGAYKILAKVVNDRADSVF